ncbi:MAG: DNA polymerase III subunit alpha [Caldilineaceae bacterium]
MANDFVHLHVHSEYSMLDGLGRIKELVKEAKRLGQPALALTDHGVMHGAIEFFRACKDNEVKPIIGIEAYQTVWGRPMDGRDGQLDRENYHLLLLAQNMTGYRNLLKIASHSQLNGYYYKPRVDHDFLARHAEGVICTTGCLGAEVPQLLMHGREQEAYDRFGWYVDVFGKENFYIELQEHSIPELIPVNKSLVPWAEKFGIGLLATNDVHYVKESDADPHEMLLCVQTGESIKSEKRMRLSDQSYFLKSRAQMEDTFRPFIDLPASAYDNSLRIAGMCEVDLEDKNYHLPDMPIPEGFTYDTYLRHLTEEGLTLLYGERATNDDIQKRKEYELSVISKMGFSIYFLIVADLCHFAKSRNIWWNVRGSGAGSLVAYCIGITGLDPLKNSLIFERFLNPARVTMPDFDLDFPDDQREEMIRYTIDKYGKDQVAQIVTFGRMKARAAIRDVGRAQEVPLNQVDRVAKLIPAIPGKPVTIQDVMTEGHEFYNPELVELYKNEEWVTNLLDYSMKLEGVTRHSGIHAAAVIVADRELTHYAPLMRPSKGSVTETVAQFEFPILESIGLLKVDFLGLSTLSVMREAGRLIKERHGIEYTLANIPFEGEPTVEAFKLLSSGEVSGVFQVESAGMRRVLTEMRPNLFEHIIATISLYRPGPLEYIPNYIRRLHGEEEVEFKHEALKSILTETLGIIIYQEQIIQVLSQLAGYTPGEADLVRRAISKKKASDIEKHKKIFIEGCAKNNIPKEAAEAIYGDIEFFARYGFNKCLPGDVEVLDAATGRLVKVEDLYRGVAQLETTVACNVATLKLHPGTVAAVMDNGIKPVYRLTTALGRTIEATANHPFYTFDGWRLLEELKIGEQIAVPRHIPVEGQHDWADHEVIALGHLLAEGNLCHPHSVYFYSQADDQVQDYIQAAEQFDNTICSTAVHKSTFSVYAKRLDRAQEPGIVRWAKDIGIWEKSAHTKSMPDGVFTLPNRQIGLLISRMWEGDGHINTRDRSLFYATASERLARQLQHLFLRLGILSRLRTVTFPYKEGRIGYQLFVTGNDNITAFHTYVACHFVNQSRCEQVAGLVMESPQSSGTKDVIPVGIKFLVRDAKERTGITWDELNETCGVAQREFYPTGNAGKSGFTRTTIKRLAEFFVDERLSRYAHSDIYWDKITGIEYVGEKQTYDLEVPGLHNFIANDILVHNSHAADYAVICVQTAYLKAHYPVDYMAALLLIERDKTEKVVNFINECRRMGISVLPPDVNYSGLDFEIQELPPDVEPTHGDPMIAYHFPVPEGSAIRFGMAAVKMVGEGPVNVILAARKEGGRFKSLEDFADRVDLRKVGKRPLECLIKVGAFDRFGKRSQLLAAIDQMVANSASVHDARISGQLSMFDLMDGGAESVTPIKLAVMDEVKGREKLLWEKELLGVYAASHPMQNLGIDLSKIVTCYCNELNEEHNGKNVTLAGMITSVRTINTKKGDQMAFVQLEDLQGQCEVVVFPRTYAEVKEKLVPDMVVIMKGKAQTREGQTSLLVDSIQNYVEQAVAGGEEPTQYQRPLLDEAPTINGLAVREAAVAYADLPPIPDDDEYGSPDEENPFHNDVPTWLESDAPTATVDAASSSPVQPTSPTASSGKAQSPAPAPEPMQDNHSRPTAAATPAQEAATGATEKGAKRISINGSLSAALAQPEEASTNTASPIDPAAGNGVGADGPQDVTDQALHGHDTQNVYTQGDGQRDTQSNPPSNGQKNSRSNGQPHSYPNGVTNGKHNGNKHKASNGASNGQGGSNGDSNGYHRHPQERRLHITFRRSGNLDRDKYRLKEIYDHVRDPRGRDRFFIRLESQGQAFELAFPNDPCTISERLMSELSKHFRVDVAVEETTT